MLWYTDYGMIKRLMAKQKSRTYARNRSKASIVTNRKGRERLYETDSIFFVKLVVCVVLAALWLRLKQPIELGIVAIQALPVGLIVGLILAVLIEKYQFNRKIWYVTLILMAIVTSFTPVGIMI